MLSNCFRLLCIGLLTQLGFGSADSDVSKFLKHLDVIPDVIDVGPQEFLNVTYAGKISADRGVQLQTMQVRNAPKVKWIAEDNQYYTLIMTDPDAPDREQPKLKEYLHWLVLNIPGDKLSLGDSRVGYMGAAPPEGSGLHRYVFLLYKQPKHMKFDFTAIPKDSAENRFKFNTREFAKKYNLGDPLAGNFFTSEWSTDVPVLHKANIGKGQGEIKSL